MASKTSTGTTAPRGFSAPQGKSNINRSVHDADSVAKAAQMIASFGRNGDTRLVHVTPREIKMLNDGGGSGSINPTTGLFEFFEGEGGDVGGPGGSPGGGTGGGDPGPGGGDSSGGEADAAAEAAGLGFGVAGQTPGVSAAPGESSTGAAQGESVGSIGAMDFDAADLDSVAAALEGFGLDASQESVESIGLEPFGATLAKNVQKNLPLAIVSIPGMLALSLAQTVSDRDMGRGEDAAEPGSPEGGDPGIQQKVAKKEEAAKIPVSGATLFDTLIQQAKQDFVFAELPQFKLLPQPATPGGTV